MITLPDLMVEVSTEFSISMLDEEACRAWFLRKIHPGGVFCPGCRTEITSERKLKRFFGMLRVSCPTCSKNFSAVTGTALNGIGVEFRALYILLFMLKHGAKANTIAKQLGMSTGAAYVWANKAKGKDLPSS